ncbi:MAG: phage virion morphogenesis protein [Fibrobacter sp.]|nr:phage virion morphogenesis protein [Fibrobacter sp.]
MADIINATIDDKQFEVYVRMMKERSENLKPVLAAAGNLAVKSVKQNFREGGRPERWIPSNKLKGKTLVGTGALQRRIHYKVDEDGVTIMTGRQKYAAIHHFGGTTKPHVIRSKNARAIPLNIGGMLIFRKSVNHPGSKIPARPYMLLQDEDVKNIKDMFMKFIIDNK